MIIAEIVADLHTLPFKRLYLKEFYLQIFQRTLLVQKLISSKFLYTAKIDWEMKQNVKIKLSKLNLLL